MLLETKSEVLIMESVLFVEKNLSILTMTHRGVEDIAVHLQHIIISLGFHTDSLIKILVSNGTNMNETGSCEFWTDDMIECKVEE